MTVTVKEVIDEARTWIDTPFVHQARVKGLGADCVGLIIGVAHKLKISDFDFKAYGRQPNPEQMGHLLQENLVLVDKLQMKPGDVLWLNLVRPRHLAIYTDRGTIIHIDSRIAPRKPRGAMGRCVEHRLDDAWRRRIVAVYRYPGVIDG